MKFDNCFSPPAISLKINNDRPLQKLLIDYRAVKDAVIIDGNTCLKDVYGRPTGCCNLFVLIASFWSTAIHPEICAGICKGALPSPNMNPFNKLGCEGIFISSFKTSSLSSSGRGGG